MRNRVTLWSAGCDQQSRRKLIDANAWLADRWSQANGATIGDEAFSILLSGYARCRPPAS